jgi:pimeloyl-ACP methyl ester carboxylesterase
MPYADNQGVRIHYRVEGDGPPLVLQHGFTQSVEDWYNRGYVAGLKTEYRLILVDSRGHGASDKPHDPESYALDKRAVDVVAVLDALGVARAHFWGYSMGAWIGFGMAQFAPAQVDRLVIGGQVPYARGIEGTRQMVRTGIAEGNDAFATALEKRYGGEVTPERKERLRSADLVAWLAAAQDRPSLEHILSGMRMPCLLYAGEADPLCAEAKAASPLIPNARFFSLPGLSHAGAFQRSDLVLPRVRAFLNGVSS